MPINYVRDVRYLGDGVTESECLQCKGRFTGHGQNWAFCPLCGTKWLGFKSRTPERERVREATWRAVGARPEPARWVIEQRKLERFDPEPEKVSGWWKWWELSDNYGPVSAADALKQFRSIRATYGERDREGDGYYFRYEYRLRLVPAVVPFVPAATEPIPGEGDEQETQAGSD